MGKNKSKRHKASSKDAGIQKLIDLCIEQWGEDRVQRRGKKNLAFPPDGGRPEPLPHSPGNNRTYLNHRARLRRRGLKVD